MDVAKLESQFEVAGSVRWGEFRSVLVCIFSHLGNMVGTDTETESEEMGVETLGLFEDIQLQYAWYFPEAQVS